MAAIIILYCIIVIVTNLYYVGEKLLPDYRLPVYPKVMDSDMANIIILLIISTMVCIYFMAWYRSVRNAIFHFVFGSAGVWLGNKIAIGENFYLTGYYHMFIYISCIGLCIYMAERYLNPFFDQENIKKAWIDKLVAGLIYGAFVYIQILLFLISIGSKLNTKKTAGLIALVIVILYNLLNLIWGRVGKWIKWRVAKMKVLSAKNISKDENLYVDSLLMKNTVEIKSNTKAISDNQCDKDTSNLPVKQEEKKESKKEQNNIDEVLVASLLEEINKLTGLKSVKEQIEKQIDYINAMKKRELNNVHAKGSHVLHMVFMGSPGTGKTTVARLLGKLYYAMGIIPENKFFEVSRNDLVGEYLGATAILTKEQFMKAKGGVLFIDEAYSLINDRSDSFGIEAVNTLVKLMEDNRDDTMVILAGYENEMDKMLSYNPGMKSRIPSQNYIYFEDYSLDEMVEIFKGIICEDGYELDRNISDEEIKIIIKAASRSENFVNARGVRELVGRIEQNVDTRVAKSKRTLMKKGELVKIKLADIKNLKEYQNAESKAGLEQMMEQLDSLVGLDEVKDKVKEMISTKQVEMEILKRGIDDDAQESLHMVFTGNPGTGKTTVARLIAKIYNEIGILPKDICIEVSRKDLIAEYIGQTAIRTQEIIDRAMGGILFIDEAYALDDEGMNGFGKEAIATLIKAMEDNRDKLMVIFAGYSDEMERFLDINPGMHSRIPEENIIDFSDNTNEELTDIFYYIAKSKGLIMDKVNRQSIEDLIYISNQDKKKFGNARGVRNLVEAVEKKKNVRISGKINKLSNKEIMTIKPEDIEAVKRRIKE